MNNAKPPFNATEAGLGIDKKCKDCGKSPNETVFGKHKYTTKQGIIHTERSVCKSCESARAKQYRQDNSDRIAETKERYHEKHHGTIKHHVQEKIATWRKASCIPSDLTVEYLIDLYEKQDGRCYYTDEIMVFGWVNGKVHHNSLSLDKLDPAKGYTQDNVVWCTYLVNTMKQNMTDVQFYEAINKIYDTTYGVSMSKEPSIADKLRRLVILARLGELPKVIERFCSEEAKSGKTSCRLYFYEGPKSTLQFYGSMGPANQEVYRDLSKPFERKLSITEKEFLLQNIRDLEAETSLNITLHFPPYLLGNNVVQDQTVVRMYAQGASVVIDVSWEKE